MNAATQPTTEPAITDMSTLTQWVASGSRFANNTVTKLPTIGSELPLPSLLFRGRSFLGNMLTC